MNKSMLNELFEINQSVYGILRFFPNNPNYKISNFIHVMKNAYRELEIKNQDGIVPGYMPLRTSVFNKYLKKTWIEESIVKDKLLEIYIDYINSIANTSNLIENGFSEAIINLLKCLNCGFEYYIGALDEETLSNKIKDLPEIKEFNTEGWSNISIHYQNLPKLINIVKGMRINKQEERLSKIKLNVINIIIELNKVLIGVLDKWATMSLDAEQWVDKERLICTLKSAPQKRIKNEIYYDTNVLKNFFYNFGIETSENEKFKNYSEQISGEFKRDSRLIYIHNFRYNVNTREEYIESLKKDSLHSDEIFILYCVLNNKVFLKKLLNRELEFYPYKNDIECFQFISTSSLKINNNLRDLAYELDWEELSKEYINKIVNENSLHLCPV